MMRCRAALMYASCVAAGAVSDGGGCALRGACEGCEGCEVGGGGDGVGVVVVAIVLGVVCDCALLGVCALWFVGGFERAVSLPLGLLLPLPPLFVRSMSSIVHLVGMSSGCLKKQLMLIASWEERRSDGRMKEDEGR